MDLINPNRDNVHSKLNSDFENSPAVSEKISPELQDVFEKINRGDVSCFCFPNISMEQEYLLIF